MIKIERGNLFYSKATHYVNAVNCVGVMGGGIAKDFKERFPNMFQDYRRACRKETLIPGTLHTYFDIDEKKKLDDNAAKNIINFPTKNDWRNPSEMQYVIDGIVALKELIKENNIESIAMPLLGAGLGGLKDSDIIELFMEDDFFKTSECKITIYVPIEKFLGEYPQDKLELMKNVLDIRINNGVKTTQDLYNALPLDNENNIDAVVSDIVEIINEDKYSHIMPITIDILFDIL